jgi:hypothetical protein
MAGRRPACWAVPWLVCWRCAANYSLNPQFIIDFLPEGGADQPRLFCCADQIQTGFANGNGQNYD